MLFKKKKKKFHFNFSSLSPCGVLWTPIVLLQLLVNLDPHYCSNVRFRVHTHPQAGVCDMDSTLAGLLLIG